MTQPYYKVIITNHIVEIYEMEKAPMTPQMNCDNDEYLTHIKDTRLLSNNLSLLHETLEEMRDKELDRRLDEYYEKKDRKEQRRIQTLRDARNECRRLAIANFNNHSFFMTLTIKENSNNVPFYDNELKKFMKRLKYNYGDYIYIAVREFQKRGALHYHLLINIDLKLKEDVPQQYLPKKNKKWINEISRKYNHEVIMPLEKQIGDIWGHGFVDIEPCRHIDNVGAYLIKYMTKNINDDALKGKKAYLSSRGLERPQVIKGIDAENLVKEFLQKKETFTNDYTSEYLGKIVYREYNLLRL